MTEVGGPGGVAGAATSPTRPQTLAAADAAHSAFGRLDILVSGAAPHDPSGTVLETSLADWQRVLDINLTGSFLLSRAVLPLDDRRRRRLDHLYRLAARPGRQRRARRLLRDKGRADPARQGHGDRPRGAEHPGQHAVAGRVETQRTLQPLRLALPRRARHWARSICWAASAARTKSPPPRCFSPATRRALSPAAIFWSTAATPRSDSYGRRPRATTPCSVATARRQPLRAAQRR